MEEPVNPNETITVKVMMGRKDLYSQSLYFVRIEGRGWHKEKSSLDRTRNPQNWSPAPYP
jgi:regulation of enolase protein 1 (concanavalin A-like superfamily)